MVRPRAAGCSRRTANKRCVTFPGLLCLQGCGSRLRLSQMNHYLSLLRDGVPSGRESFVWAIRGVRRRSTSAWECFQAVV
jgi:hypothetical protein